MASSSCRLHQAVLLLTALGLGSVVPVFAQSAPDHLLFGPTQYLRTSGAPNSYTDSFTVPASVGAPFLLHIINGNADGTSRVSSATITINNVQVAGPNDFNQNVAVVDRTVTLQPTTTVQVTLASGPAGFLTINVFGTKILPTPATLTPNPLTITAGATGTLTATLSPTPTTAGTLNVSSANPGVATVPASISFASGQTQVPVPVTAVAEGSSLITVSLNGGSASATVQVTPAPPTVTSLLSLTLTITQGGSGTLTVKISSAQGTDTTVTLSSSDAGVAFVPAQVTVPAAQTQATVTVNANTPGTAQITASLNGSSATSTVTVTPTPPTIVSLLPPTNPVTLGATTTLTVTISAAQPTETVVAMSASPAGIVTVPASVTVPANQIQASITVGTVALGSAMVKASLNGSTADSAVQVVPPAPAAVSLLPSPLTVVVGATGTLTVTLNAAQLMNTDVALTVDQGSVLQVPAVVTVPANQTQASFTVTGLAVGTAVVTATVGSTSQSATVPVVPPPPAVVSLLPNPLAIQQGATGAFTLTINAAQLADTVIPLTNSASTVAQAPASVTVPAGQTSVVFLVSGLTTGTATVTATINATSVSATVQVTPPPTVVTALTPGTVTVPKGNLAGLHVAVAPASTEPQTVTLTSSNETVATVPVTVPIPAGSLGADFPVMTVGVGTATITASLNGGSASATVVVTPAELVTLTLSLQMPTLFIGQTQPFTATGTFTDGTTQDLTTSVTWTSSNQVVATINASGVASALAAGTTTITAASGSINASTTLTVLTPPALSLTPATATLLIGNTLTLTVTSAAPADVGGLTVTLSQSGSGNVTVLATVLIPEGLSSATFTVTGGSVGSVTLNATAPIRLPATSTLTVIGASITGFTPASGTVGTAVTISGQNFDAIPANNQVRFNGVAAVIASSSTTSITTTVPQGATTGPITVTTPQGTAVSPQPFTVTPAQDFTVTATPPSVPTLPGSSVAYSVSLVPLGTFSQLAALSVTNLPPGAGAVFTPPYIGPNGSALLAITTTAATPVGSSMLEIRATATIEGTAVTRTAGVSLTVQASGQTVLTGQVLDDEEKPLAGVSIKLGGSTLTTLGVTDAAGNFFIPNMPTGQRVLLMDGSTANTAEFTYPTVPLTVTIQSGLVNTLGFIPYLRPIPTAKLQPITPGQTTVLTDPEIPGFKMTIPAGVQIIGWDGQPNTQVAVTATPVDRSPLPPIPPGQSSRVIYLFSFGKLGGGTPTGNVPVDTPNDVAGLPGDKIDLYYFNEAPDGTAPNQWEKYGTGTVSSDGTTIITDINPATGQQYGMPRFCCGARRNDLPQASQPVGPSSGPTGSGAGGGDPVNLATGFFSVDKTDLVLPGLVPLQVTRTYRTNLTGDGPFGVGTTGSSYDRLLLPPSNNSLDALVLYTPGNHQDLFSRQPDGTFTSAASPALQGAVVMTSGGTRVLTFRDKAKWIFNAGNGLLISQADRNGNTVTITRDGQGRMTQVAEPTGRKLTVSYSDSTLHISTIRDSLGRTVSYAYDGIGRLTSVTDPAGGVTRYTYDAANRMLTLTDARGITFLTNEYDSAGRVSKQTQADGGVFTFAYQAVGTFVTSTTVPDPRGNALTYRFNGSSFPLRVTDALGQSTTFTRTLATNQLTATTDVLGRATRFTYDANGNTTSVKDPQGQFTLFEYDLAINRLTTLTDALTQATTFTYDTKGNVKTTTDPLTHATSIAYNANGRPASVTDALNNVTTFEYDAAGNLITTTDPLGNRTTRTYDAVSRLSTITDPRDFTTQFAYDALNRVTQITDANGGLTGFTYDPNGNLLSVKDAKDQVTTYTYDNMDRLLTRTDALGRVERYEYDKVGNLTKFTDRKNQVSTFTYDALNRRTSAAYVDGSTTSFFYDAVGRLVSATDSVAGLITFVYDTLDRLVQEVTAQGSITYTYDVLGRRTAMTVSGQQPVSYGYDAASRLVQVQQGSQTVGFGYDAAGRRTALTYPNSTSTTYSYDTASRLTNILHQGPSTVIDSLTYTYDAAGNRVSITRLNDLDKPLPTAVQAAYDAANEQIQFNSSTPNLAYDLNGNLVSQTDATGTTTYTLDARNRLIARTGPGTSESYSYDALGRRISKTINGTSTQFLHDGNDIVAEIQGSAVVATYLRSLSIDEMFGILRQEGAYFSLYDGIGSTLALTDQTGTPVVRYSYDPFGNTQSTNPAFPNSFQYAGRENDNAGLYYNRLRYYSPLLHRFIREDPIGLLGGVNVYSYVLNNPLSFTDPLGLDVTVTLYQGAKGLGHIGLGVNTAQTVGLYPTATANGVAIVMGLNVQGIVKPDTRQKLDSITIPTSPQQDQLIQKLLNEALASPQTYNLYVRNCAVFVESILFAANLQVPVTEQPRELIKGLRQLYPQPGNR